MTLLKRPPLVLGVKLPVKIWDRAFGWHDGGGNTRKRVTLGAKPAAAAKI